MKSEMNLAFLNFQKAKILITVIAGLSNTMIFFSFLQNGQDISTMLICEIDVTDWSIFTLASETNSIKLVNIKVGFCGNTYGK